MVNLLNYDAETGANAIGDDTTPTLTLSNTGGPGFEGRSVVLTSTASIDVADVGSLAAATNVGTAAANSTVVGFTFTGSSIASGAIFGIVNASSMVSATTIDIGASAANANAAIRVVKPDGTFGWIPILDDAAVTGTAV